MTKRNNKKRILSLAAVALVLALVFSGGVGLVFSPKLRYIAGDRLKHIGSGAKLERTSGFDFDGFSFDELAENEKIEFNYNLMLINEDFPIKGELENELDDYNSLGVIMDKNVCEPFAALSSAVFEKFGETLYISSSYRTAEEQAQMKADEGEIAQSVGASEHQAGLALDVYVNYFAGMGFIKSKAGQFVNDSCFEYGFIIRYPYYGKGVTGIAYEPWHLRFVGRPHSDIISKNSTTLEEYIEGLEIGEYYQYDGYVISRQREDADIKLPIKYRSAQISPDNCGNYLVTVRL